MSPDIFRWVCVWPLMLSELRPIENRHSKIWKIEIANKKKKRKKVREFQNVRNDTKVSHIERLQSANDLGRWPNFVQERATIKGIRVPLGQMPYALWCPLVPF